jgi:hypothetical protein
MLGLWSRADPTRYVMQDYVFAGNADEIAQDIETTSK